MTTIERLVNELEKEHGITMEAKYEFSNSRDYVLTIGARAVELLAEHSVEEAAAEIAARLKEAKESK